MRALWLVLLLLSACDSDIKRCEHARDVVLGMWETHTKEALASVDDPAERDKLAAASRSETETARGRFVEACLALPPAGKQCIARIDELTAAERDKQADLDACDTAAPDGLGDEACRKAAKDRSDQRIGACEAALEPMLEAIQKPEPGKAPFERR